MQTFATQLWPWVWQILAGVADLPSTINSWFRFITGGSEGPTSSANASKVFAEIIRKNSGVIHGRACAYADTREDREDLSQEIIVRLWKRFHTYRGESKVSSWMYTVATGTAKAWRKRRGSIIEFGSDLPEGMYDEHFILEATFITNDVCLELC